MVLFGGETSGQHVMSDSEPTGACDGGAHVSAGVAAQTMWALLSKLITALLSAATMLLTGRWLSEDEFGSFSLAFSIVSVWFVFAEFGVGVSVSKHVAQYRRDNRHLASAYIMHGLLLQTAFTVGVSVLCWLSAGRVARVLDKPNLEPLLWIGSGIVLLHSFQSYALQGFLGDQRLNFFATIEVVREAARLTATALLLWLGFGAAGVLAARATGFGVAAVTGLPIAWLVLVRGARWNTAGKHSIIRTLMHLSPAIVVIRLADMLYTEFPVSLLGFFLATEQVAYYSLPVRITVMLQMPAHALALAVAPRFAVSDPRSRAAVRALFLGAMKTVLVVYVPVMFGIIALAPELLALAFGAKYLPSSGIMRVYAVYLLAVAIGMLLALGLIYLGRARARAALMTVIGLVNLGLDLVLIPRYGIMGAAIAVLITYVPTVLIWLVIACRTMELSFRQPAMLVVRVGLCGLIMGAGVYLVGHGAGVMRLIVAIVGGVVVYALTLLGSRTVTPDELRQVISSVVTRRQPVPEAQTWDQTGL